VGRTLAESAFALLLMGQGGVGAAAYSSALIAAVKNHDRGTVNALLDRGADVNGAAGDGATGMQALLAHGATVDATEQWRGRLRSCGQQASGTSTWSRR
jgi:hypothetical protein